MTLTSFFQELFRTFLYRVSLDRRTLLTIHDPGLRLVPSDGNEKGNYVVFCYFTMRLVLIFQFRQF